MNKSYKYTILTLFLALVFAFGSMAGMNLILRAKERQLLTERGRAIVEAPVRSWQGQESGEDGETDEESGSIGYALTTGQVEEILSCWNNRTGVTVHNPVSGQISMEEAIKEGKKWLVEMEIGENGLEDTETYSVSATLGIATQKVSVGVQSEPYHSFWTVQFSDSSMYVVLHLNAVTGKVWNADITLYEDMPEGIPYEKLEHFVELSGLQIINTDIIKNANMAETEFAQKSGNVMGLTFIQKTDIQVVIVRDKSFFPISSQQCSESRKDKTSFAPESLVCLLKSFQSVFVKSFFQFSFPAESILFYGPLIES